MRRARAFFSFYFDFFLPPHLYLAPTPGRISLPLFLQFFFTFVNLQPRFGQAAQAGGRVGDGLQERRVGVVVDLCQHGRKQTLHDRHQHQT